MTYTDGLTAVDDFVGTAASGHSEAKVRTAGLAGIGRLPLGDRYSVFGKIGYSNWEIKARHEDRPVGFPVEVAAAEYSGWDLSYGGGFGMQLSDAVELRAEYEISKLYSDIELRAFLVGATWRF